MTQATSKKPNRIFTIFLMVMALAIVHLEYLMASKPAEPETQQPKAQEAELLEGEIQHPSQQQEVKEPEEEKIEDSISASLGALEISNNRTQEIEHYRVHLKNLSQMVTKFLSNDDYQDELTYLISHNTDYPTKVTTLLKSMKIYREKYLKTKSEEYLEVKLEGSIIERVLNRMVNIKRANPVRSSMEVDYKNIKDQIDILEDYFYSQEFLKYYLSHD